MHTAEQFLERLRSHGIEVIEGPTVTLGESTIRPLILGDPSHGRGPIRVIVEDAGAHGYSVFTSSTTASIDEDVETIQHHLKWS